ncbi:MAG: hypothetical protein MZU97_26700 [Bacillus subtilis]|nr:hypothetical protein [Bacillus subtilis]
MKQVPLYLPTDIQEQAIAADSSLYNEGIRPNDFINLTNGTIRNPGDGFATVTGGDLRANVYIDSAYYIPENLTEQCHLSLIQRRMGYNL